MSQPLSEIDAFLAEETRRWTVFLRQQLVQNLQRRGVRVSGEWVDNVVANELGAGAGRDIAELLFPTHGRMQDMGAGNGYRLGQYVGKRTNATDLRGRKGSKIYSRTAYGTLNTLINNLANKFVQHTAEGLKHTLSDGRTT